MVQPVQGCRELVQEEGVKRFKIVPLKSTPEGKRLLELRRFSVGEIHRIFGVSADSVRGLRSYGAIAEERALRFFEGLFGRTLSSVEKLLPTQWGRERRR